MNSRGPGRARLLNFRRRFPTKRVAVHSCLGRAYTNASTAADNLDHGGDGDAPLKTAVDDVVLGGTPHGDASAHITGCAENTSTPISTNSSFATIAASIGTFRSKLCSGSPPITSQ